MTRKTVLLLPGLLCDRTVWESQIAALQDVRECLVPDYGYAESITAMAEEVLSVAPERFALAGHSMGGRVALEVMRMAPARVEALALLDTGFKALADGDAGDREISGRMRLLRSAREDGMRAMGAEWLQGMVHPDRLTDTRLCGAILDMIESKTPEMFERQITALIARPDATDVLREVRCPTVFVCGRQDAWSPLERHEEMASLAKGSRVVAIEDAGHMSTMERPDAASTALREWLLQDTR